MNIDPPAECAAVTARKQLIAALARAVNIDPEDPAITASEAVTTVEGTAYPELVGSEFELLRIWELVKGVVAEYTNGGDEVAEMCNCDNPRHVNDHRGMTFDKLLEVRSLWRRDP